MNKRKDSKSRSSHLKWGLIYLVLWIGVLVAEAREFEGGGLLHNIMRIQQGEIYPLFLVIVSVVLLALLIRSFLLYFQTESNPDDSEP